MLVSGLAPDLDYASYFGGPAAFLKFHRTLFHSLTGAAVLSCVVAGAFCLIDRKVPPKKNIQRKTPEPLSFGRALVPSAIGGAGHIVLDVASGVGVQLLWPFRTHWSSWPLTTNLDLWILILLIAGLLLPLLFRLVNEEVGERRKAGGVSRAAIFTLFLVAAYLGVRAEMHSRAIDLLLAREYHGRVALSAGAFPQSSTPFDWRGVVVTDGTIEEADVPLGPGEEFDPNRSLTHYKPEDSPALDAAQETADVKTFLKYAEFPMASVQRIEDGYRVEVHDLRFASDDLAPSNVFVRVDFDSGVRMRNQAILFAASPNP